MSGLVAIAIHVLDSSTLLKAKAIDGKSSTFQSTYLIGHSPFGTSLNK
jgi:hypothetical protein